jgi:kynurenine formamidase
MKQICLGLILIAGGVHAVAAEKMPAAEFQELLRTVSNWQRWGSDDQLGTLNLVTPDVRRAAAREVREGVSVSLARIAETKAAIDNNSPYSHTMLGVGTEVAEGEPYRSGFGADRIAVSHHGFVHSHIDALAHIFNDGSMYNDFPQQLVTPKGASVLSVINLRHGVLTRGVLVDIPALLGKQWLDHEDVIDLDMLERWERASKVRIRPGDAVLFYTGHWARRDVLGPWDPMLGVAGVHPRVARLLKSRDVAIVGSDATLDALPSLVDGAGFPMHTLAIVAMGMPILDALDLEALSKEARARMRTTFLLQFAPLPVDGATGSPVNPIATF